MNRKNTILIAVMINAGLLCALLIAALTTQEEAVSPSTFIGDATPSLPKLEEGPLFGDAADNALRLPSQPLTQTNLQAVVAIPLPEMPKPAELPQLGQISTSAAQDQLIHKLPPLVPETMPIPAPAPVAQVKPESGFKEVVVKKGDNLDKIAKSHHTTVDEIIKVNHLPSSFLRIGQVLKIPAEKSLASTVKSKAPAPEKKATEGGPEYYTVKVGDNPWTIAMKHHIKVEELLRLNGLNEERARKLKPGDRLRTR